MRQITELKELRAGGKALEQNQLDKIATEEALRQEIAALNLKLEESRKAGQWR